MVNEYIVGQNQHKNYSLLIDETNILSDLHIRLHVERNAFVLVEVLIASTSINVHIECTLLGEGADARISGIYWGQATDKITITTVQQHDAAHTRSTLIMKGVLRSQAQAHYHGNVRIEKEARGTYASQENKNILLSNTARALSVPTLEVLNHDVHCSHGSAIGRFDEEQLFYAAARGIDEKTAQKLLLRAFCADVLQDELLKEKLNNLLGNI